MEDQGSQGVSLDEERDVLTILMDSNFYLELTLHRAHDQTGSLVPVL